MTGLILFDSPNAPHTSLADTLTIIANASQGLVETRTISFSPDAPGTTAAIGTDGAVEADSLIIGHTSNASRPGRR